LALAGAGAISHHIAEGDGREPVAREIRAKERRSIALASRRSERRVDPRVLRRPRAGVGDDRHPRQQRGHEYPDRLVSLDEAGWDTVVDTDLKGVAFVTQAALLVLRDAVA